MFVACVAQLPACSTRDPASSNERGSGTLSLSLATTSQGRNYRLRQASFDISGPSHSVLDNEQNPDAPSLSTQLDPGSYEITLNGPWFLERLDADGPVRLTASLTSANPARVEITAGSTSSVVFRFATDGTMVTVGGGALAIGVEIDDTSSSTLPPGLNVLAGKPGGWGFADGVSDQVRFNFTEDVSTDGAGKVFVNDNGSLRQIELASGKVTTLIPAESWEHCFSGMVVIARDLYFGDPCDSTIRRMALDTREITLVAGSSGVRGNVDGHATEAQFDYPKGLVTDGNGNLYVSDPNQRVIRKLVLATGEVTTLAGFPGEYGWRDGVGSDARFTGPGSLTFNGDGNLYVADGWTIRKVALANAQVSTFAGVGIEYDGALDGIGNAARFNYIEYIASDDRGNLYVPDFATLRKIAISNAEVTTIAGQGGIYSFADGVGLDALFGDGRGTAYANGELYIADPNNHVMRKVSLDSTTVTTFAGTPRQTSEQDGVGLTVSFEYPQAAVSDGLGNLYVTDTNAGTIRKVVIATGATSTVAGRAGESGSVDGIGSAARFVTPTGITRDGRGNLYVTDRSDHTVRKIVPSTGEVTTVAGKSGVAGNVNGVGSDANFDSPQWITSDGADNLYVSDYTAGRIRKIALDTGRVTTVTAPYSGVPDIHGLASDHAGSLYFSNWGGAIQKLVVADGAILPVAGSDETGLADGIGSAAQFEGTTSLAYDGAGQLYVVDGNRIRKIELSTNTVSTVVGVPGPYRGVLAGPLPARLNGPDALAVVAGGLAIVDEGAVLTAGF